MTRTHAIVRSMETILTDLPPKYLTKEQARHHTNLSLRKLDMARACGALPSLKIGKRVLFKLADLEAFLERYRVTGP